MYKSAVFIRFLLSTLIGLGVFGAFCQAKDLDPQSLALQQFDHVNNELDMIYGMLEYRGYDPRKIIVQKQPSIVSQVIGGGIIGNSLSQMLTGKPMPDLDVVETIPQYYKITVISGGDLITFNASAYVAHDKDKGEFLSVNIKKIGSTSKAYYTSKRSVDARLIGTKFLKSGCVQLKSDDYTILTSCGSPKIASKPDPNAENVAVSIAPAVSTSASKTPKSQEVEDSGLNSGGHAASSAD